MSKRCFALLIAGVLAAQSTVAAEHGSTSEALIGSWALESRVTTDRDGAVVADANLSATPSGLLIYDRSGHVAAQLSRPARTPSMLAGECEQAQKVKGTPDTAQPILGYDAYFGTYSVDAEHGVVTHHLESALFPGDIGKNIERRFTLSGDSLTIRFDPTLGERKAVTRSLAWRRRK